MATVPERFPDSLGLVAASLDEPANIRIFLVINYQSFQWNVQRVEDVIYYS